MSTVKDFLTALPSFGYDPTRIQRASLQLVKDYSNGERTFVDPTNPVVLCLETAAVLTAGFLEKNEINTRKQYSTVAQTQDDLYRHMSDKDYIGRFATPSSAEFTLLISEEELLNRMVEDRATNSRKVVIPRNTFITVSGITFSLQHPIIISQLQHGGLQIVYDTDKPSPLQILETNDIDWEPVSDGVTRFIRFSFTMQQFNIISKNDSISSSKDFSMDVDLSDQYYHTRVYAETASGWVEILTTHSDQVYDPVSPTAVLRLNGKRLNVRIPQIYTVSRLLGKKIRVDVYETKGPLDMMLGEFSDTMFGITWMNYDKTDDTVFSAPMRNFRQLIPFSTGVVSGGTNELPFEKLRERVMRNAIGAKQNTPISNIRLESALEDSGYSVVRDVDNITSRVLLATKAMPDPSKNSRLITAAGATIETVSISMEYAVLLDTVINNGSSITITPDTLYRQKDGVTTPVPSSELAQLMALPPERRALAVTEGTYRYTPFHYVLDTSGDEFDVRPYHLDTPEALTKSFIDENATTLLQVSTQGYGIFKTNDGYRIQIVTLSSKDFRELPNDVVHVQLSYIPIGEKDRAYLNGEFVGLTDTEERIYSFDLASNFNVDSNDNLQLSSFLMYTTEDRLTSTALTSNFDILYSVSSPMGNTWIENSIDDLLGRFLLPGQIAGVTHETLRIKFGSSLKTLWSKGRSYVTGAPYKTWEVDVPAVYKQDVYQRGTDGSIVNFNPDGSLLITKLHSAGDEVLDEQGSVIYEHRIGDIKHDLLGEPILNGGRGIQRQADIFLIEGTYWFANDVTTVDYRKELVQKLVSWIVNDLGVISKNLLEKTRIYFYPKTTIGLIDVTVADGLVRSINADQSIKVSLEVSEVVYKNETLKKKLTEATIKVINEHLSRLTISMSALNKELHNQYGQDVINSSATGLGGDLNLTSLVIRDDATRCSLRKRLVSQADNALITEEDVTITWSILEGNKK